MAVEAVLRNEVGRRKGTQVDRERRWLIKIGREAGQLRHSEAGRLAGKQE